MDYTIAEVSTKLNISKVTLYKKIKQLNNELKTFLTIKNGVKYLDDTGIEIIRNSMNNFNQVNNNFNHEIQENPQSIANDEVLAELKELKKIKDELILQVKSENELLKNEIVQKNKQIEELNKALSQSQKINENNQVLMREQQQRALLLENEEQKESRGFWSRMFKN